jgi:hypothetical protein
LIEDGIHLAKEKEEVKEVVLEGPKRALTLEAWGSNLTSKRGCQEGRLHNLAEIVRTSLASGEERDHPGLP